MVDIIGELDASIQAKLEADNDFQMSIVDLPEEERTQKIQERKSEELNSHIASLKEGSEKYSKAQELANNYKIRAEKAEQELKAKTGLSDKETKGLALEDTLYLAKAPIHEEDITDVLKYAQKMDVSVKEAHKFLKPILDVRDQERKTAMATNTQGAARGASKVSGDEILSKADRTGEVPETEEGLAALFAARQARRLNKKR